MRSKRAPTAGGKQTNRRKPNPSDDSEQESEPAKKAKTVSISKELDHYFGTGWHMDVKDYCIRGGHILTSMLPSGRRVYFLNTSLVPPPAIEDDNKDIPCSGPTNICCVFCLTNFTNIGSVAAHANKCKFKFMWRDLNSWGEIILRGEPQRQPLPKNPNTLSISKELSPYVGTGWHKQIIYLCFRGGYIPQSKLPSGRRVHFLNPSFHEEWAEPVNISCVFCFQNFTNIGSVAAHANKCKIKRYLYPPEGIDQRANDIARGTCFSPPITVYEDVGEFHLTGYPIYTEHDSESDDLPLPHIPGCALIYNHDNSPEQSDHSVESSSTDDDRKNPASTNQNNPTPDKSDERDYERDGQHVMQVNWRKDCG